MLTDAQAQAILDGHILVDTRSDLAALVAQAKEANALREEGKLRLAANKASDLDWQDRMRIAIEDAASLRSQLTDLEAASLTGKGL